MRDFQNTYPNDGYTRFDKEYACWANNHNGWSKAKKKWRRIGKKRMRDQTRREVNQWEDNMATNKIKITRCESGDWEILEYAGYRDSNHHINYINFLRHLGYEVEEIEVTDEEMEEMC